MSLLFGGIPQVLGHIDPELMLLTVPWEFPSVSVDEISQGFPGRGRLFKALPLREELQFPIDHSVVQNSADVPLVQSDPLCMMARGELV